MYRRFLTPWFSKEAISVRENEVRAMLRRLVQGLADKGEWDFVPDMADVVPGTVMCMILGLDPGRRAEFSAAMDRGMKNQGTSDATMQAQMAEDRVWLNEQLMTEIARRRESPAEDFLSYLVRAPLVGDRLLTDQEILDIVLVLFVAGFHTTSGALAAILVYLAEHPVDRARLMADPALIPAAIDEIVRVYAPATGMARTVTKGVEFGGVSMSTGDKVLLLIMSANRDSRKFPDADTVDFDRHERGSVAFGWGVHRCLGIHLARLLLKVEIETLFELMPDFEIDLDRVRLAEELGIGYVHESVPARRPA
jgi:cytochrome P450